MNFKLSANIGFLWDSLPLAERIQAAHQAGFDAVECHFPYDNDAHDIKEVLLQTGLPMVGINTALGQDGSGDFGVAALPGKQELARSLIDQAIDYAIVIDAANINVVAGLTGGAADAEQVYCDNLKYACDKAAQHGKTVVIEPLNPRAVQNYHFNTVEHAVSIIDKVEADNLKLMFDFFHAQIVQGDLETLIRDYCNYFGHIQISAVHDRGEPDVGELNYPYLLSVLQDAGYTGFIGAEYKPRGQTVEAGLSWMSKFRDS
ncbi:MAG: hydroxypyruvate isomerase family protein [Granulosicoccus sp.]